jgi:nucleoside-diphosphate-sugar epimerase
MARVVIVGATGLVGRRVTDMLAATAGFEPVGLSRRAAPGSARALPWRIADATDAAALAACLADAHYAVNCMAGDGPAMIATTRNLCAAARAAGVRRLVHLSSMVVYGEATGLVAETHPLGESGNWYARAKMTSESLVADFVRAGGDGVILRPGCIHGPRSEQWTGRIARLLRQHRIGDLGAAGDGVCNLVHVDDVAAAVVASLVRPGIAGEAFNVADPDPGSWNDYFVRLGRAIGAVPVRRISGRWLKLETKVLSIPLKLGQIAAGRAGLARFAPDPLPRSVLPLWRQDIRLDHRKADAGLGFPRTQPDAAIASAAAWVKAGFA